MRLMIIVSFVLLCGCTSATKHEVRSNRVASQVFAERLNDPDPAKRPTDDDKNEFIRTTARSWKTMDNIVNGTDK